MPQCKGMAGQKRGSRLVSEQVISSCHDCGQVGKGPEEDQR